MDRKLQIGNAGAVGLLALALFFDATQFVFTLLAPVPVVGVVGIVIAFVTTLVAYLVIPVCLVLFFPNLQLLRGRQGLGKLASLLTPLVIELVPFLAAIPALTPGLLAFIVLTRIEDGAVDEGKLTRNLTAYQLRHDQQRTLLANRQLEQKEALRENAPPGEEARLQKDQERADRKERREFSRESFDVVRKEAFALPKRQAAPGVLAESAPEDAESEFPGELERYDRAA